MYSYDEVFQASLDYFNGDELAAKVAVDKYLLRDNEDNILEQTPEDMHWRLAKEFYRIEKAKFPAETEIESVEDLKENFNRPLSLSFIFSLLDRFKYIVPAGSIMFGCGNSYKYITLSNCYLLELPEDSYGGILRIDEQLVQISKRRGGVGINISNLRPAGTPTTNSSKTSTGIIPFMQRYSNTIREVGQAGRRGALLISLNVHHPEIESFITSKHKTNEITGANISVMLTDEFLHAVEQDECYQQRWPIDSNEPIINRIVSARDIWNKLIKSARDTAEPGLLLIDNIHRYTPADCYETYRSQGTNACSEINMSPLDACRLLSLNLYSYVINPFSNTVYFDYNLFYNHSIIAQRIMDDIVDLESEKIYSIISKVESDPEDIYVKQREIDMWHKIKRFNNEGRRTGSGITALGDTLAALGITYGSEESINVTEKIYRYLKLGCYRSSVDMARILGPFSDWDSNKETNCEFLLRIKDEDPQLYSDMQKYGRRNIALTTTAPTGSLSILTQTSSGIEPVFMLKYTRRKKGNPGDKDFRTDFVDLSGDNWMEFEVLHPKLKEWMQVTSETDINKSPWYNCCAEEINWINRVRLQSAAQKHVCHSISSTLNLPENVSVEEVAKIYETAWKLGLKGITVYRKNCRTGVLVEKKEEKKKRPRSIPCDVHHISSQGKNFFVLIGLQDNKPFEIFAGKNNIIDPEIKSGEIIKMKRPKLYKFIDKSGDLEISPITMASSDIEEALTRMMSVAIQNGTPISLIITQLEKCQGTIHTFAKCIARILKKYVKDGTEAKEKCPECNNQLIFENSCKICKNCGYSACS